MTRAWVVRGGQRGEDEEANLASGRATVGWAEIGDLGPLSSREAVRDVVEEAYPDAHPGARAIYTGQLWAFREAVQAGDLILMPLKTDPGRIAFGRCVGPHGYDAGAHPHRRHHRPVEWQPDPVPRSALQGDLLAMVNASLTVFSPSRNDAVVRLEAVAAGQSDPGAGPTAVTSGPTPAMGSPGTEVTDPVAAPTLDAIKDRVRTHVMTHFLDHDLTRLVAAILEVMGFECDISPVGPDGGVDILAGTGPFGFGAPTVVVEVKSEPGAVGSAVLRTLHSAVTRYGADHGVLVAWGGVSKPARAEFAHLRTTIRVWDSEALLDKLFETYDRLPETIRARLTLKRAWVLDDDQG